MQNKQRTLWRLQLQKNDPKYRLEGRQPHGCRVMKDLDNTDIFQWNIKWYSNTSSNSVQRHKLLHDMLKAKAIRLPVAVQYWIGRVEIYCLGIRL